MTEIIGLLIVIIILVACGTDENREWTYVQWECLIAEQTDYFDGTEYHRFYRGSLDAVGYARGQNGVAFTKYAGNPILQDAVYPILVIDDKENRYLIVQHRKGVSGHYLYSVNDPTRPVILNGGKPILRGDFCNVAVSIVGDRWHMLIEGKANETFHLRYSCADWPDLDFNRNLSEIVIQDAGNPAMTYIRERNAILALYGADYRATGVWRIRAAVFDFARWRVTDFILSRPGVHLADPDLVCGVESSPVIVTIGAAQETVDTYYYRGTKAQFFDDVLVGAVELVPDRNNPTMTILTGWQ